MKLPKKRLDVLLLERGFFPTRAKAQAAILAGQVRIPGVDFPKAGLELAVDAKIEIAANTCPYVSRGGLKLAAALEHFKLDPTGHVALDVGSSTGGFTDCLLQHGTSKVYAVDVGTKQLDIKLRNDPRVTVMEQTHARDLRPDLFDPKPDLAVIDVSFISLTQVLPWILPCLKSPADILALIKPQFEVGPRKAPKGVVKVEEYRQEAIEKVRQVTLTLKIEERGILESPLRGAKGNVEYLIHLQFS